MITTLSSYLYLEELERALPHIVPVVQWVIYLHCLIHELENLTNKFLH